MHAALGLAQDGANATDISRLLHVPRRTACDWIAGSLPRSARRSNCPTCGGVHPLAELSDTYVYLLGLYLGDGCISGCPRGVYKLRIFLDAKYPRIVESAI